MSEKPHTLFLRLEGPLQSWGVQEAKFVVRRSAEAPTKSGVIGLLCAAMGVSRADAPKEWLPRLSELHMGARIDRPAVRWWDYHTVGAEIGSYTAQGKIKRTATTGEIETFVSRREYLCDASFLVALQGDPDLIAVLRTALENPVWTLYLGRKSCPPSRPILEKLPDGFDANVFADLESALRVVPWHPRLEGDEKPKELTCLLDWISSQAEPNAPPHAEVWYDVPLTFEPPSHRPRFVQRQTLSLIKAEGESGVPKGEALQGRTPPPPRPRADYTNRKYQHQRKLRLTQDHHLCVFCKAPATTVQHITYRHAGGDERPEELRALCRLCHDAVTMIEYGLGMGMDRINPEEERWRDRIIEKRDEIVQFRSMETRRRRLTGTAKEDVE